MKTIAVAFTLFVLTLQFVFAADGEYDGVMQSLAAGDQNGAEQKLVELLKQDPQNSKAWFLYGVLARSRFDLRGGIIGFAHVIKDSPETPEGLAAACVLGIDFSKDPCSAVYYFNSLVMLCGQNPESVPIHWMSAVMARTLTREAPVSFNLGSDMRTRILNYGVREYETVLRLMDPGIGPILVHQTMANMLDDLEGYDLSLIHREIAVKMERNTWTLQGAAHTLFWLGRAAEALPFAKEAADLVLNSGKPLSIVDAKYFWQLADIYNQLGMSGGHGERSSQTRCPGLVRMGVSNIDLFDFDIVEDVNLDRLLHATAKDAAQKRLKVDVIAEHLKLSATAHPFRVDAFNLSIVEESGFRRALDCDVLFSCVDRPWPRHVLNFIAYAHLIPVVDGGIKLEPMRNGNGLKRGTWRAHVAAPTRQCLECLGQYDPSDVSQEQIGLLDDSTYIAGLAEDHRFRSHENVFAFSMSVASMEMMQFLRMIVPHPGYADIGAQTQHFVSGRLDTDSQPCKPYCPFCQLVAQGDRSGISVTGHHEIAEKSRIHQKSRKHHGWLRWLWSKLTSVISRNSLSNGNREGLHEAIQTRSQDGTP